METKLMARIKNKQQDERISVTLNKNKYSN